MKHKILVTGGLGFIGSHTVVELIQAGYEVVIVDDLSNSQLFILDNIEKITGIKPAFYQVNMLAKEKLAKVMVAEKNIAAVIHFAASKAAGESVLKPLKYFTNNLCSLIHLLECMETFGVRNIVFSSSATVYGEPDELPVTEGTPFKKALSAYGSTKQMGEGILEKVAAAGHIHAVSLRYFNPVGAHGSALLGELPTGTPNNLLPFVTQVAAGKLEKLTVYGNEYNTPDGTCVRDYIHVADLAKAHVKSCERLLTNKEKERYEVFNIGTGNGISVLEILEAFQKFNAVKLNYSIGKRRDGDAPSIYADVSKAENILGWKAALGLQDMVTSAWRWQKHIGIAGYKFSPLK
jgi:UDP-glucose 4-epimerase